MIRGRWRRIVGGPSELVHLLINHRNPATLAVALALAAVIVTGYVALVILEAMPHVQDDLTYLFQARVFAMGRLWVPASPVPEAFEQEFIVNYAGRAFGKYPPGHPLILVPGVLAQMPWLINPLQAGLTVLVVYQIGRLVYGARLGLIAALLVTSSPFFIFMSGSMMAHPTGLLFLSLFVLMFVKMQAKSVSWGATLLCGVALGFAFITRPWTAVAVSAPFLLYAVYSAIVPSRRPFPSCTAEQARTIGSSVFAGNGLSVGDRCLRSAIIRTGRRLTAYSPLVAGLSPFVLFWLVYNYLLTGDALKNPMELWWAFDRVGFGPGIGIFGAHTIENGLWNTYRNFAELVKHLYGWPVYLTLAFAFVPFLARRASRFDWLFVAGSLSLVLAQVAWWADGIMYGPRYYYEILGLLALLTARGAAILSDLAGKAVARRSILGVGYLFVFALIAYNVVHYLPEQWSLHRGYNYISAAPLRAVESSQIRNALVFVHPGEWYEWWNYGAVFTANTPSLDGDVVFAKDGGPEQNGRVASLYPGRSYYRLTGLSLEELQLR